MDVSSQLDLEVKYEILERDFVLYRDLISIEVHECSEPFTCLSDIKHPNLIIKHRKPDMLRHYDGKMYVRQRIAKKLLNVAEVLKGERPAIALKVVYGFRLLSIQKDYFDKYYTIVKKHNPHIKDKIELIELTHRGAAAPDVAGHPTGGAVDVGLFDKTNNDFLDMGSSILTYENTRKAYTYSPEISQTQLSNRLFLKELMETEDFAPYLGEWWHFSHGDKEWAKYYNKSFAFYGQVHDIHQFD